MAPGGIVDSQKSYIVLDIPFLGGIFPSLVHSKEVGPDCFSDPAVRCRFVILFPVLLCLERK